MDNMTGENFSSNLLRNIGHSYWSVRLYSRRKDDGIKRMDGEFLASCEHYFFRVLENLAQINT